MKRKIIFFILFVVGLNLLAQKNNRLDTLNLDQLYLYKEKAIKLRNAGAIMTVTGGVAFIAGSKLLLNYIRTQPIKDWASDPEPNIYSVLYLCGAVTFIIGVPLLLTGSNRKTKVDIALKKFDLKPTDSRAVGIGITLRF